MNCFAKQFSDQCHCEVCGKSWDVNDSHPPACDPDLGNLLNYIKKQQEQLEQLRVSYNLLRDKLNACLSNRSKT